MEGRPAASLAIRWFVSASKERDSSSGETLEPRPPLMARCATKGRPRLSPRDRVRLPPSSWAEKFEMRGLRRQYRPRGPESAGGPAPALEMPPTASMPP